MPIPHFKTYGSSFAVTSKLLFLVFKIPTRTLILSFFQRLSGQARLISIFCTISCCNVIMWYNNGTSSFCVLLPLPAATSQQITNQLVPKLELSVSCSLLSTYLIASTLQLFWLNESIKLRICVLIITYIYIYKWMKDAHWSSLTYKCYIHNFDEFWLTHMIIMTKN